MAKYHSQYTGPEIDEAIGNALKQKDLGMYIVIDSSVDNPFDLDTLIKEGTYTVEYFTGAVEESESGNPIEIKVFTYPDGSLGQRYEKDGITYERKYDADSSEWEEWKPVQEFRVVEGDDVVNVGKDIVVFRIVKDASEVTPVS